MYVISGGMEDSFLWALVEYCLGVALGYRHGVTDLDSWFMDGSRGRPHGMYELEDLLEGQERQAKAGNGKWLMYAWLKR